MNAENSVSKYRLMTLATGLLILAWIALEAMGWMRVAETRNVVLQQLEDQKQFGGLDEVGQYTVRLKELKADLLKADIHRVGYFNYKDPDQPIDSSETWVLTQYALAPIVVHASKDHPVVIGDFLSPRAELEGISRTKLTPVRNYGRGVIVFRNQEAK